ncbi:hypothetical protein [Hyphomonas sp.]|uniref:hypothetical protein n=1 Tax=Hyphomonas sp. TaxID=87 RepID=UPI0039199779
MSRSRRPSATRTIRPLAGKQRRAYWRWLRAQVRLLSVCLWWLQRLPDGRVRSAWTRIAGQRLSAYGQILRALLVILAADVMRKPLPPPKPFPGPVIPDGARTPGPRRAARHFSLSLKQFTWMPKQAARPAPRHSRKPGPRLPAPNRLETRLAALQAVFAAPEAHAARMARRLLSRGLTPRRAKALIPEAALWLIADTTMPAPLPAAAPPYSNTS